MKSPASSLATLGSYWPCVVHVLTRNSPPEEAPDESTRWAKTPLLLPSSPLLVQTTTKRPEESAVTDDESCVDEVQVLTRNSGPRGAPDKSYRWPKMPSLWPSWRLLVQTTTKPLGSGATAGRTWPLVV